jgi:hypothetical protein
MILAFVLAMSALVILGVFALRESQGLSVFHED